MGNVTITLFVILYNLIVLGATGYVVFGLGHSGWWFLFAYIVLMSSSSSKEKKKPEEGKR